MPQVSVIVPIYNVDRFLSECIDSILMQSLSDIEVLLVDDGSTDKSGVIADSYAQSDPRVRVIRQENQGLSGARNTGIAAATAEWFTIVDGDDWLEADALRTMLDSAQPTGADIVLFSYFRDTPGSRTREKFFTTNDFDYTQAQARILQANCLVALGIGNRRATTNVGVTWARLYRTSFLRDNDLRFKVGLTRMQDAIFHLYAFGLAQKVSFRDKPIYHYRVWPGAASRRFSPQFAATAEEILNEIARFMERMSPSDFEDVYYTKAGKLYLDIIKLQYVGNPMPLAEKRSQLTTLLNKQPYSEARARARPKYMSPGQAVVWPLIRMGLPLSVYLLYALRDSLRQRRAAG